MPEISVIICTYNPRIEMFSACLDHIVAASSLIKPKEVLIVDNNSSPELSQLDHVKKFSESMPNVKIFRESTQGLTPARLRGIKESTGDLLVFIDDDNFIDPRFFEAGSEICDRHPELGSWSGQVKLIFEEQPADWTKRYWGLLVHREFKGTRWSNLPHLPETMPCGAGLYVRRKVAEHYLQLHESGKRPIQLDRSGTSLFSAGDNDLAACACDIGLGVGVFDSLIVDHYIPKERTTKEYLLRLAEGIAESAVIFRSFRGEYPKSSSLKNNIANTLRVIMKHGIQREFQRAVFRGERKGRTSTKTIVSTN